MLVSSSEGRCLEALVTAILLSAAMIAVAEMLLSMVGGGGIDQKFGLASCGSWRISALHRGSEIGRTGQA